MEDRQRIEQVFGSPHLACILHHLNLASEKSIGEEIRCGLVDGYQAWRPTLMICPRCGQSNPIGSAVCQSCGIMLPAYQAKGTRRSLKCIKCGMWLPFDSFLVGVQICGECEARGLRELENARLIEERRKCAFVSKAIADHPELRTMILTRLGIPDFNKPFSVSYEAYEDISNWHKLVTHAKNFCTARRYEDAAKIYESLELWKEAGDARERKGARTVKHVNVNLNDLIDKLRSGGLSVPYKCGSCGASIVVDRNTSPEGLKFCSYCGSSINTDALLSLLQDALK